MRDTKLSKLANRKLSELGFRYKLSDIWLIIKNFFLTPSGWSLFVYLLILGIVFILIQFSDSVIIVRIIERFGIAPEILLLKQEDSHFQNLIAIIAGIGAIVTAMVFYVVEASRDNRHTARVYMKGGYVWPLSLFSVGLFFAYIWIRWIDTDGGISLLAFLPIVIFAFLTMVALMRVFRYILDKEFLANDIGKAVENAIRKNTRKILKERLMFNILYERLESKDYQLTAHGEFHKYKESVYSAKTGAIKDVNLKALRELSKYFADLTLKEGFGYPEKTKDRRVTESISVPTPQEKTNAEISLPKVNVYIFSIIYAYPDEKARPLLEYDNRLLGSNESEKNNRRKKIEQYISKIFIIGEHTHSKKEVSSELLDVEAGYIKSIEEIDRGSIETYTNIYKNILSTFILRLKETIGQYDNNSARKERSSIVGGWDSVEWLTDSTKTLFEVALKKDIPSITKEVLYLPRTYIRLAIENNDAYVYQETLRFIYYFRWMSLDKKYDYMKGELEKQLLDNLKSIIDYDLETKLDNASTADEEANAIGYVKYIYLVVQNLLKFSYDDNNEEMFDSLLELFSKMFTHYKSGYTTKKIVYASNLNEFSELVVFALSSFLLDQIGTNENAENYFQKLKPMLPKKFADAVNLYQKALDERVDRYWDWDSWDRVKFGEAITIRTHERLRNLLALLLLQLSSNEKDLSKLKDKVDPGFINNIQEIINIVNSEEPLYYPNTILSESHKTNVKELLTILQYLKKELEDDEQKLIREMDLDPKRIKKFIRRFFENFKKNAQIRYILLKYNLVNEARGSSKGLQSRGFNEIVPKEQFLSNLRISHSDMGDYYGRSLANWENTYVLNEMITSSSKYSIKDKSLKKTLMHSTSQKFIIAINVNNFELHRYDTNFQPNNREGNMFVDYYKYKNIKVPVYHMYIHELKQQGLLILNTEKLGTLNIYPPKEEKDTFIKNNISISVLNYKENFNHFDKILKNSPKWLKKYGDKKNQEKYLQQHAIVKVFEKITFKKDNNFWGYFLDTQVIDEY